MLRRVLLTGLSLCVPSLASAQLQAPWDGAWGDPRRAMVTVRGRTVLYHWQGQRQQISGLSMTSDRISFRTATGRTIALARTSSDNAQLTTQLPGGPPQSWPVRRQR